MPISYLKKTNKRPTILFVVPYGFNERMSSYIEFINARLLAKNGWHVMAITRSDNMENSALTSNNISIYRYKNIIYGFRQLLSIFLNKKPQITHIITLRNNRLGIIAGIMTRMFRGQLLATEYGLLHDHYLVKNRDNPLMENINPDGLILNLRQIFRKGNSLGFNIKNYLFHWPLTHADYVVFVSRHNIPIAKKLGIKNVKFLPYILDSERWGKVNIDTIQNKDSEENPVQVVMEKIKKLNNQPYVLFIGQLKLRKGWDILLKAIPLIPKNIAPYFVFVTPTTNIEPEYFTQIVTKLGVQKRIIFLGGVNNYALKEIVQKSSVIAMPSRYEGFGLPAVESLEMGKPLVASDVVAINETIKNGYNGLLFPPEDHRLFAKSIERVLTDDFLRHKLVSGGKETFEKFKSKERSRQWIEFYEAIIS